MVKTYLYLDKELDKDIETIAKAEKKAKAAVMRDGLKEYAGGYQGKRKNGAEVLMKIGELAKKYKIKGPKDASTNLDEYLYGNKQWKRK